jgi:hypothetical protein
VHRLLQAYDLDGPAGLYFQEAITAEQSAP